MADTTQYHVTLRSPLAVKVEGTPMLVRCFDATVAFDGLSHPKCPDWISAIGFRVVRMWALRSEGGMSPYRITQTLIVPQDNIAGLVAQPFDK